MEASWASKFLSPGISCSSHLQACILDKDDPDREGPSKVLIMISSRLECKVEMVLSHKAMNPINGTLVGPLGHT